MTLPFVSVVIPCRDEEAFIGRCLDSVLANDYPVDRFEVLVLDGMSKDATRAVVGQYAARRSVRLLDNPHKTIPAAMNLGLRAARGDIIVKIDAHSTYPPDYVRQCVRFLEDSGADNVGGVARIVPGGDGWMPRAIARALSHSFGSGNAYVKVGLKEPRWADTAAFGCYRRESLERVGGWNEDLAGSSDLDLNRRLRRSGGRILLVPEIVVTYTADPDLRAFWRHNFADGVWVTYALKFGSVAWSLRHWIPMGFTVTLLALAVLAVAIPVVRPALVPILALYALIAVGASVQIARQERAARLVLVLPLVFLVRHLGHGVGALWGLLLAALPGRHWMGRRGREA